MNISSTRRVTGSSGGGAGVNSTGKARYAAGAHEQFVERIDTSNQVSVNADARDESRNKEKYTSQTHEEKEGLISSDRTYVAGAVEAVSASGVYDEPPTRNTNRGRQIGVYDANQTMVKDEAEQEQEKFYNEHYVKHLYENNEPPEEIDELV